MTRERCRRARATTGRTRSRDRLGSLDKGKIANIIVTSGDLFNESTRIRHVFIDGRMVNIDTTEAPGGGGGRGRGGQ